VPDAKPAAAHVAPMSPVQINLFPDAPRVRRTLEVDFGHLDGGTEEITVYAPRSRRPVPAEHEAARPIVLGGVTFTSSLDTSHPGLEVLNVTASLPIPGIPGLDAVANVQRVRQTDDLGENLVPVASPGPPLGLRLTF
jgi:hypothetical protein